MCKLYNFSLKFMLALCCIFSTSAINAQYCTSGLYSYACTYSDFINSVSTTGGTTNISNLNSGCNGGGTGFTYFTTNGTLAIQAGQTFNLTVVNNSSWSEWYKIFIDYNGDLDYLDAGETVWTGTSATPASGIVSGAAIPILVPVTATSGNTRIRIRCVYGSSPVSACSYHYGGEIEDYPMSITPACNGPIFTAHPTAQNFCPGGTAAFSAAATNGATHRWQVSTGGPYTDLADNSVYSNTATTSLSLANTPAGNNGYQYRLKSTSSCGTPSYSNAATLTMFPPVVVSGQTQSILICEDASTTMNVTVSNTASGYQWQYGTLTNGYKNVPAQFPFSGTTASQLDIASVNDTLNGISFRCIVGGPCSADTSADIPMNVITGPFIAENPKDDTTGNYQPAQFDIVASGTQYILYWQASVDNGVTYVNINENSLYRNTQTPSLYITSATPAQTGMKFRCILKSTNPACGLLRDTSEAATLYVGNFGTSVSQINKSAIDVTLYPNPVTGNELNVRISQLPVNSIEIKIIDKLGRVMYAAPADVQGKKALTVPVNNLAPGIYTLQLFDTDKNILSTSGFTKQ